MRALGRRDRYKKRARLTTGRDLGHGTRRIGPHRAPPYGARWADEDTAVAVDDRGLRGAGRTPVPLAVGDGPTAALGAHGGRVDRLVLALDGPPLLRAGGHVLATSTAAVAARFVANVFATAGPIEVASAYGAVQPELTWPIRTRCG